jgi:hypothetical protein
MRDREKKTEETFAELQLRERKEIMIRFNKKMAL